MLYKFFEIQISWKSVQREQNCLTRTDTTKLIVAFSNFGNAPKIVKQWTIPVRTAHSSVGRYIRAGFILTSLAVLQPIHIKITNLNGSCILCHASNFAQATLETFKLHIVDTISNFHAIHNSAEIGWRLVHWNFQKTNKITPCDLNEISWSRTT